LLGVTQALLDADLSSALHEAVDARLFIPMKPGMRSLNIAVAAAMVLGEALRQTKGFPAQTADDPAER
jgi:tRNA (cytidine/uridine-2'-O-)-methyltransferase